ncbi:coiled-coil domain-containing protein 107 isoform X2 [Cervus canadensis]|uniref:coiled-coil domain-containing protein 107 isoform X2 n=1 Tax=Cervus canadensis TaxID=1574408 RepID=UPI001C9E3070|nr:coiled-coil domain-containing protein 107 isoform X2 [Cervus canadensis]
MQIRPGPAHTLGGRDLPGRPGVGIAGERACVRVHRCVRQRRRLPPSPPVGLRWRAWCRSRVRWGCYLCLRCPRCSETAAAPTAGHTQQGKDEAAVLQEEEGKKDSLQSEQQLAQLTQQLVQTEQHLNSLMAQLDPLFERVTTLAGAQQELLHMKLQTIHQLLQDSKPNKGVEVPEPEASIPFAEDFCIEEDEEEAGDSQAWEEPLNWNTGTRNLAPPREMEPTLRRRCRKSAAQGRSHSPHWKEGKTVDGLVKQSLFL